MAQRAVRRGRQEFAMATKTQQVLTQRSAILNPSLNVLSDVLKLTRFSIPRLLQTALLSTTRGAVPAGSRCSSWPTTGNSSRRIGGICHWRATATPSSSLDWTAVEICIRLTGRFAMAIGKFTAFAPTLACNAWEDNGNRLALWQPEHSPSVHASNAAIRTAASDRMQAREAMSTFTWTAAPSGSATTCGAGPSRVRALDRLPRPHDLAAALVRPMTSELAASALLKYSKAIANFWGTSTSALRHSAS